MIVTYDKNPALRVNDKLQSLSESVQLALNEKDTEIKLLQDGLISIDIKAPAGTVDGDLYRLLSELGWANEILEK